MPLEGFAFVGKNSRSLGGPGYMSMPDALCKGLLKGFEGLRIFRGSRTFLQAAVQELWAYVRHAATKLSWLPLVRIVVGHVFVFEVALGHRGSTGFHKKLDMDTVSKCFFFLLARGGGKGPGILC